MQLQLIRGNFIGWLIYDEDKNPISNFRPEVLAVVNTYSDSKAEPVVYVKLRLLFGNNQRSEEFLELLSCLESTKWLNKDIRCRIHPEVSQGKSNRYLMDCVRLALPTAPVEKLYRINQLGVHLIEDEPVFCTGGGLVSPPAGKENGPNVELEKTPFNLDIDSNITEKDAVAGMLELISLCPNAGRIISTYSLLYLMRKVYQTAWKSPCFSLFLHGLTGTKKTTISAFLTQVYNRDRGIASPPRLNSSIAAAVAIIYEKRDCVVVLDDLFPAESNDIRQKQEETLFEITRIIADGIEPGRMRGKQVAKSPPTCGVLFTGEYLIGTGSNAARLLPVEMTPIDGEKLKQFQDNPLIVSTFYYYFINWFISNYHAIADLLKQWLEIYRRVRLNVHPRLQETHYFLNTAYTLLLQYCFEIDIISEQEAKSLHRSFLSLLTSLVQTQNERANQNNFSEPGVIEPLARIRTMYQDGSFHLADSTKQFTSGHDGLIHDGCLCLRGENFRKKVCTSPLSTNYDEVLDALEAQGALKRGKDKRTIQIYGTSGKRFYAIPLEKLR